MRAHQAELAQRVRAAASACHASLGHAQSVAWLGCVQTTLIQEPAGFPVQKEATLLKDLLLNYTCDVDDGGTPAIRSVTWSWRPPGSAAVPVSLRVDVLQESPPILLVDDFVSDHECSHMVNASMGDMMPSPGYPSGGNRRSYSASLFPRWDVEGDVVARVSRRLVAFVREAGGYPDVPEVGQEPLSAVYYREAGDEFRSHCDGECRGGAYWAGRRIATSLTYCQAAEEGGHTIFSLSAIKVVPRKRRMLFFGYKLRGGNDRGVTEAMDGGLSEHAGCPIRRGTKVVLTQWLREAVTAERDWRHYARLDGEETFRNAVARTPPPRRGPPPSPPPLPSSLSSPQCEQPLTAAEARSAAAPPSRRAWVAPPLELGTGAVSSSESLTSRAL